MKSVKESRKKIPPSIGNPVIIAGNELTHTGGENCICNRCIDSYLLLYEKIEKLEDERLAWRAKFSREKKDKINAMLSRRIKVKKK